MTLGQQARLQLFDVIGIKLGDLARCPVEAQRETHFKVEGTYVAVAISGMTKDVLPSIVEPDES